MRQIAARKKHEFSILHHSGPNETPLFVYLHHHLVFKTDIVILVYVEVHADAEENSKM